MSNGFGTVTPTGGTSSGNFNGFKTHKIKGNDKDKFAKTHTILRFAPPMREHANDPRGWRKQFWGHYGYQIRSAKDPAKLVDILFPCVRQWGREKNIERECPEDVKVKAMKERAKALGATFDGWGKVQIPAGTPDDVKQELTLLAEWLKRHNVDSKTRLNAWDQNWVPGRAIIARNTVKLIEAKVDKGTNIFDLDRGAWLDFTRVGNGAEGTPDTMELVREGGEEGPIKSAAVPQAAREAALREWKDGGMPDVGDPSPGYILTFDQVQAVVNAGEDPEAIARIVGITQRIHQVPASAPVGPVSPVVSASPAATTMTRDYPVVPTQFRAPEDQPKALEQVFAAPAANGSVIPVVPAEMTEEAIIALLNRAK